MSSSSSLPPAGGGPRRGDGGNKWPLPFDGFAMEFAHFAVLSSNGLASGTKISAGRNNLDLFHRLPDQAVCPILVVVVVGGGGGAGAA